jgi:calcium release-activated calcium channel protein 1
MALDAAQALLSGIDTAYSKQWREEDRAWRADDVAWRQQEREQHVLAAEYREEERRRRVEDLQQRGERCRGSGPFTEMPLMLGSLSFLPFPFSLCFSSLKLSYDSVLPSLSALENARHLWTRHVEMNARQVQEKAEQLQNVSNNAALIAGFGLTALLQFEFEPMNYPVGLMVSFSITTSLVVGLNALAMILSSFMHASVLRIGKSFVSPEDESEFISRSFQFYVNFKPGTPPPVPRRNFSTYWARRFEGDWKKAVRRLSFTTGNYRPR